MKKCGFICVVVTVCFLFLFGSTFCIGLACEQQYEDAFQCMKTKQYTETVNIISSVPGYSNKEKYVKLLKDAEYSIEYEKAKKFLKEEKFEKAEGAFQSLGNFKDSKKLLKRTKYRYAKQLYKSGDFEQAKYYFEQLGDYEDSKVFLAKIELEKAERYRKTVYKKACKQLKRGQYRKALQNFELIKGYRNSVNLYEKCLQKLQK